MSTADPVWNMHPYNLIVKPVGARCNMRCGYCFYPETREFDSRPARTMDDAVLETMLRSYFRTQHGPRAEIVWTGGEPTLAGLKFFRKAVAIQQVYGHRFEVRNSLQTNGVLLDDEWCDFLLREDFLVGLSLDGPEEIHDAWRRSVSGHGMHYAAWEALGLLQRREVPYRVLASVTAGATRERGAEVYRWMKSQGVKHLQLSAVVEREAREGLAEPPEPREPPRYVPQRLGPGDYVRGLHPACVSAEEYGECLIGAFDEWANDDTPLYVREFNGYESTLAGNPARLCTQARICGNQLAVVPDGSVYSCDHYVYRSQRLGNLMDAPLGEMARGHKAISFGTSKSTMLPKACRECEHLPSCWGGCPRNRFLEAGGEKLNWLCCGFRKFYDHAKPVLRARENKG